MNLTSRPQQPTSGSWPSGRGPTAPPDDDPFCQCGLRWYRGGHDCLPATGPFLRSVGSRVRSAKSLSALAIFTDLLSCLLRTAIAV